MLVAFFLANSPPSPSQPDYLPIIVPSVIAIIAALLGALVAYWLTQRQSRRGLVYRIVSDTPILGAQKEIEGRVKILFEKSVHQKSPVGTPQKLSLNQPFQNLSRVFHMRSNSREVKDLRLAIIEVQNTGRTPILPGDFIVPLTFSFTRQKEVLDTGVVETNPSDLKPGLEPTKQSVTLKPLLLNKNDRVRLKILAAGVGDEIEVSGRIAGIEKIVDYKEVEKSRQKWYRWIAITFILLALVLLAVSYAATFNIGLPATAIPPLYLTVILAMAVILTFTGIAIILLGLTPSSSRSTFDSH